MLFNKVYIINLARNKEKLIKTFNQLAKVGALGQIPVKVIEAHDGRNIDEEFLKNLNISVFEHWKDPWFGRGITTGEIGCALSHNSAWKDFIDSKIDRALILEDDVVLSDNFLQDCEKLEGELSKIDFEFLYLGRKAIFPEKEQKISENILIPNYSYWTNGYVISQEGANKLFNTNYLQNIIPVDEYIPYLFGRANKMIENKFDHLTNLLAYSVANTIVNPEEDSFRESETEKSEPYVSLDKEVVEYDKRIHILTVATEKNDGLTLLEHSAKKYGISIEILGLDEKWTGGNKPRLDYAGGGQKVNLLKKKLKEINDEDIVLFTDAYDVIYNATINEIVGKFLQIGADVVFSAETSCWPDENLKKEYPYSGTAFRFLNSGAFIGYAKKLKEITSKNINDEDDDQLYYTHKFLESIKSEDFSSIALDSKCSIFQSSLEQDVNRIDGTKSRFFNPVFRTVPCVIHGNGDIERKLDLQQAANHLVHLRNHYGYCQIERKKLNENDLPVIFLNVNISKYNSNKIIKNLFDLEYPKDKIIFHLNILKGIDFSILGELLATTSLYREFSISKNNSPTENMNSGAMAASENFEFDYMFTIDQECEFENLAILKDLLVLNKNFVSPFLRKNDFVHSNLWPGEREDLSHLSDSLFLLDYKNIIENRLMGCWIVPFVDGCFLIKSNLISKIKNFYKKNLNSEVIKNLKPGLPKENITFCANLIELGVFMHVDNQKNHGRLCN